MTEKTKAVPGAARKTVQHGRAKPVVTETKKNTVKGLAFLIEDVMERTEVVLAAQGITTKLQDMAETLSTMEAKDIMPLLDSFRETFGAQAADQFSQVATAKIRELIGAVQTAKSGLDNEIDRLVNMVNGADASDAAMDAGEPPAPLAPSVPAEPGAELPPDAGPEGDVATADGLPGVPPSDAGDVALGATGFAGRARKESARAKRGRRLTEENAAESSDFKAHMDLLAGLSPKCFTFAHDIADSIHDLSVSGDIRNKLTHALGHVVAMASSADVWDDPAAIADTGISAHLVDGPMAEVISTPEVAGIIKNLHRLAHMVAFMHSGDLNEDDMYAPSGTLPPPAAPVTPSSSPLAAGPVMEHRRRRERNIKRLRESRNPDKMIFAVFRSVFRECRNVGAAVSGTARAFGIDATDVVTIIREAKQARIEEDAVPALMGVPMGQPDANSNPVLMSQVPKPTAAAPQPGKPNQPMTPQDMRQTAQARQAQDKAAGNQPKQPIVAPTAMAPVQQVKPGQQQLQPVLTPQMQQQQIANQKKKFPPMPGKIANTSNMAESNNRRFNQKKNYSCVEGKSPVKRIRTKETVNPSHYLSSFQSSSGGSREAEIHNNWARQHALDVKAGKPTADELDQQKKAKVAQDKSRAEHIAVLRAHIPELQKRQIKNPSPWYDTEIASLEKELARLEKADQERNR